MRIIELNDYTFPVIGYNQKDINLVGIAHPKNVYGTAFSIGNDFFFLLNFTGQSRYTTQKCGNKARALIIFEYK